MKFDLTVSKILENAENPLKTYRVYFLKYGINGEYTQALSSSEAIENVARKHKKSVQEFQSINGATAKLVKK